MANCPNFANREVANLILTEYKTKKPFLYVDWANVTSTSFESERVFATGGQSAPNRVQFDGQRTGTVTVEAQVYPAKVFQMLSGNDFQTAATIIQREKLTATADGLKLTEVAADDTVQVFAADDDCGTEIEATAATTGEDAAKATAVTGDAITDGKTYIVYYYVSKSNVQVIHFDSKHFAAAYRIEGSTPFKTESDDIIESRHIWYKAAPQGAFELSWQNTGDPASITLTFDVMADADGNIYDMVFPNA